MYPKTKLLVICGPTVTGKTALGIYLAKKFAGEIVSADSRQVYQGMDIGTGKDVEKGTWKKDHWELERIPLWLLDVVKPNEEFSVAYYVKLARKALGDIWKRNKLPILVGGTGFYIKGLVDGIDTLGISPDWSLRRKLEVCKVEELFEMLARFDSLKAASMNASDRKNPRRLIRAIEIANRKLEVGGEKSFDSEPSTGRELRPNRLRTVELLDSEVTRLSARQGNEKNRENCLFIGLTAPLKTLYQKIDERVEKRIKQGILEEIKKLFKAGYTWENSVLGVTAGYREWQPFFEGKMTEKEVVEKWRFAEHNLARRQMTWFRRDSRIRWFDITLSGWQKKVEQLIKAWYNPNESE